MKKKGGRKISILLLCGLLLLSCTGCGKGKEEIYAGASLLSGREVRMPEASDKYRTFYEIFVYSFYDSNGDGIGDLAGVTEKLDYLNDGDSATDSDLGISGIWLMPIMPSNTYHKYDVKDYMAIDPVYGSMEDFEKLVEECGKRDINLIIDLVMNHTSSAHPWFQEACSYLKSIGDGEASAEECPYVEYYNFHKGMKWGYSQVADTDWYYEANFWSEMPDLNLYSEKVRAEFEEICKFWLEKGVAGFRLDAVKEFVSEDTEANVEILTWFNDMVKGINPDTYLVGEAWTNQPEYAKYYASGMDSVFDFVFAGDTGLIYKLASGLYQAEQYGGYVEKAESLYASYNENYVNAPFYNNHDLDRAAGYYKGEEALDQAKIAAALNLTMSGNAFVYYGDEIGMLGSGIDENKRLGMRWTTDQAGQGMCKGPQAAEAVTQVYGSLEEQQADLTSMYCYYKNLIRLRNQFPSITKGKSTHLAEASDKELCVLQKTYGEETVCLFYNISGQPKTVDLSGVTLADGTVLKGKMLEASVVAGEGRVAVEKDSLTIPGYSVVVLLVTE